MKDFLIEIGTEELPPKALRTLIHDFAEGMQSQLAEARIDHGLIHPYATPRRLALVIEGLAERQSDQTLQLKGPPVKVAFDGDGVAQPAATAFADKCGVPVAALEREITDKGEWLVFRKHEEGASTVSLLSGMLSEALLGMSIPRRMRWGSSPIEFVRPVHWVLALHGEALLDLIILGVRSGEASFGHRFMSDGAIRIRTPDQYEATLRERGYVIADLDKRRDLIVRGVEAAARAEGGSVVATEALYDEVAALVEWPEPIVGSFDERFLSLPREVITSTLSGHQRYFSIEGEDGSLLPRFITVANIASSDPRKVVDGNERVVRPRLSDAEFFWNTDLKQPLEDRRRALASVVYQKGLGSIADKVTRVEGLVAMLAHALGVDPADSLRAAALCKSDLVTGMVGEFPELQGIVGRYYALEQGETPAVAAAIEEHYLPRHANDALPGSIAGQIVAVADRLDTLAGLFVLNKKPSGNRDPFGLRRAALAVIRILLECRLDIDLEMLLQAAVAAQPKEADISEELENFVSDRLRGYVVDRGFSQEAFAAVAASEPRSLVDFLARLDAVRGFHEMPESTSLAAANKRIANILKKADVVSAGEVDEALLQDAAEKTLYAEIQRAVGDVRPLMDEKRYAEVLTRLASLRAPVDAFFDDVMVMADDAAIRSNRLTLLSRLRDMFLGVADISRL